MSASENEPIAAPLQKVLSLFTEGPLAGVAFPDVDASSLTDLAEAVHAEAQKVTAAEAAVTEARAALAERQVALRTKAQRALAYARIYADGAPELRPLLDEIDLFSLSSEAAKPAPKRRGRPPKVRVAEHPEGAAGSDQPASVAEAAPSDD